MIEVYHEKINCCGCTACYNVCPKSAISMTVDGEGFSYPVIDENLCIDCGLCKKTCPLLKNDSCKNSKEPDFYVAKHKNVNVLLSSTSGGAFTALSDAILRENGVIYGVDFDDDFNIVHKRACTCADRDKMRFSKYAQSNLNDVFTDIKHDLECGKKVLFTGTPCQNAGLKSFLENNPTYSNLYICDVICHSIPSPLIWKEYCALLEREHNSKLEEVYFRTKKVPWCRENSNKGFTYKVYGDNNYYTDDRFYQLFFGEMTIMRPSCEHCHYTDIHRASDITIADYWGIEKYSKDWYDSNGVSLVLVSTSKGVELLNKTSNEFSFEKRPKSEQLTEQKRLSSPPVYPKTRPQFWKDYHDFGFEHISNYLKKS